MIPAPDRLRDDLAALLQETDPHRGLDSLETVAVRAHLVHHGLTPDMPAESCPTTIEGWVTWVAERSRDS